jgi:hypothetical protein
MAQHTGEIIGDLIPLAIFIYLALVINGVIVQRKPIKALENPTTLIKLGIYGGIVIFLGLIIISLAGK